MIGVTRRILDAMLRDVSSKDITHDVLTTLMAEVCAIVNARPLVPVSSDPDNPSLLSPATLLTGKQDHVSVSIDKLNTRDMYAKQWKHVQVLAELFWSRWRREYLQTLQPRRKWLHDMPNVKEGDIVLLKQNYSIRNQWPMGVIETVIPSSDDKTRKVVVRISKDGKRVSYTRPISEVIILISDA